MKNHIRENHFKKIFIDFNKEKNYLNIYTHTNLYKTILNVYWKLDVSGEILPLSREIIEKIWKNKIEKKKVVFANVSKTTLRN